MASLTQKEDFDFIRTVMQQSFVSVYSQETLIKIEEKRRYIILDI